MKIFFVEFKVVPTHANEYFDLVEGAIAHCWIKDNSQQSAYARAEFYISKEDWDIVNVEEYPIEVSKKHFIGKDNDGIGAVEE